MEMQTGPTEIPVDQVRPNPYQPRVEFEPEAMRDLVESVRTHGVLQPILVRRLEQGGFELIAGERRLRASREAGLRTIPALIRECGPADMLEIALIENLQREDINPMEAARAYQRLMREFGLTQEEVARRVGKARPTIANTLRLLTLPEPIQESIAAGEITEAHARRLLQAEPEKRLELLAAIRGGQLTVQQTEAAARPSPAARKARKSRRSQPDPLLRAAEERLESALGTKVAILGTRNAGRVVVEFYSEEHLDGILERIAGP
jgi:ParB family chromosome partitioning protein